jgi:hypothetical protein
MAFNQTLEMMEQGFLELRADAIRKKVLYDAATTVYETVLSKIPTGSTYSAYRDSLQVIESGQGEDLLFGVQAIPTSEEEIDAELDLIFFKPAKRRGKVDKVVEVLMQYQPWTLDTLPITPDPAKAVLISRKASRKAVEAVNKARKEQKRQWTDALLHVGVRPPPKKEEVDKPKVKGMPDFVYQALGLEFGIGGVKPSAAWRPAIAKVNTLVASMFSDNSAGFAEALLDWQNTEWKQWKTLSAKKVPLADVATFVGFQDKIV